MDLKQQREVFERQGTIYEAAILTFHGVDEIGRASCRERV